eukprot:2968431-Pyramimonas_sp.AAC.1
MSLGSTSASLRRSLGPPGASSGLLRPSGASWDLLWRNRAPGEARSIGTEVHKTLRIGAEGAGQTIGAH